VRVSCGRQERHHVYALTSFSFRSRVAITAATSIVTAQRAAAPPLVITAHNGGTPTPYTVPRTPWGDPDLQGVWSSDDTSGIPRERPKEMGNNLSE
jgi:hypothetical protein